MRPEHSIEHGMFVREYAPSAGARESVPVIWIHGLGESGLSFESLLAGKRWRGRRHLVPDLPGYGRATWPSTPLSLCGQADRLAAWLDGRGVDSAVLVGHSMGGVLALVLAERHPGRITGLVDVEGNKTLDDCVYSAQAAGADPQQFAATGFDRLRERIGDSADDDTALRGYYASLRLADPCQFLGNAAELVELSRGGTLVSRLAAIDQPRLYIGGVPRGAGERTLAAVKRAGIPHVLVEGAGHWPFLDRPEAFAAALDEFLARL
ncbi:MAG: alpha/beta hydrolase [Acidobacteriota bacterium]|nr:alpha/beta hydrolase [Acidobacteriota bacterium]